MPSTDHHGVLLLNLGTPDAPEVPAVRRYLGEFLMDERVIDVPGPLRWLLVHGAILPFRPARSAHAYRKIWTAEGSPLLVHGRALEEGVRRELGDGIQVALAMRYGQPSMRAAMGQLASRGVTELTVVPLYPQGAASSSGSSIARVYELAAEFWDPPRMRVIPPFFDDSGFLDAFASVARRTLERARPEHVLFSFHGVPERHVRRSDPTGRCLAGGSCSDALGPLNRGCYRAQAFATARWLAGRLGLGPERYSTTFQSRLGRAKWIEPHTDKRISELARAGVKRLAVVCPSFVADCLETLEEIGIRGREQFKAEGGEELALVPSLNAEPEWVKAVARMAREGEVRHEGDTGPSTGSGRTGGEGAPFSLGRAQYPRFRRIWRFASWISLPHALSSSRRSRASWRRSYERASRRSWRKCSRRSGSSSPVSTAA